MICSPDLQGQKKTNSDTLSICDNKNIAASFFRDKYLHNDIEQYLDNYQEFVTYQVETTGDISKPNPYVFSIFGNSFRWNKYYVNNFRINDHYFTGSALHKFQATNFDIDIDMQNTSLRFATDTTSPKTIAFAYNHGGNMGGVAPGTKELIHLFHRTAREAMYIPIEEQRRVKNSYNIFLSDKININGKLYTQNMSLTSGSRLFPDFDYKGITKFNAENYNLININGQLPAINKNLFTESNYIVSINRRENMFSEFYYNSEETAKLNAVNISLFGSNNADNNKSFSSGFNLSYKNIRHNNLNFMRNIVDQDGEGFEPWYPDGNVLEFSHALYRRKNINRKTAFITDMYNSFINFKPTTADFHNPVYYQSTDTNFKSLYIYEWKSRNFATAILENTYGIEYKIIDNNKLKLSIQPDIVFDAIIISEKSLKKINWQTDMRVSYIPNKLLHIAVTGGKKTVPFNFEQARYISGKYMNAEIYYWNDNNNNMIYENGEASDLFSTTGGYYHNLDRNIKQTGYYYFDLPIKFKTNKHSILFYGFYRQYTNTWTTYADGQQNGIYANPDTVTIFLQDSGTNYFIIKNTNNNSIKKATGTNSFLFNNPFSLGYTIKYRFNTNNWIISLSWSAYTVSGYGAMGNGPLHNDIAALSESTASPNRYINYYGRLDSDRAYICRFLLTHKLSDKLSFALQIKYKDGQVFTDYNTFLYTDNGNTQIAIWENNVKGDNFITGKRGARKDAFFNTVLRAEYKYKTAKRTYAVNLSVYNIYDFGTELAEYTFKPVRDKGRYVLELNSPRGIIASVKYFF